MVELPEYVLQFLITNNVRAIYRLRKKMTPNFDGSPIVSIYVMDQKAYQESERMYSQEH